MDFRGACRISIQGSHFVKTLDYKIQKEWQGRSITDLGSKEDCSQSGRLLLCKAELWHCHDHDIQMSQDFGLPSDRDLVIGNAFSLPNIPNYWSVRLTSYDFLIFCLSPPFMIFMIFMHYWHPAISRFSPWCGHRGTGCSSNGTWQGYMGWGALESEQRSSVELLRFSGTMAGIKV